MKNPIDFFLRYPGGNNDSSFVPDSNSDDKEVVKNNVTGASEEEKPLLDKIQDALQDWSNKDQADLDHDDRTP